MFDQKFKNIDNIPHKDTSYGNELYFVSIIDSEYQWNLVATPKKMELL